MAYVDYSRTNLIIALLRRIAKDIPRSAVAENDNRNRDPIVDDLMKLTAHKPMIVTERGSAFLPNESINHYSSHLSELLYLLNEERDLDDTSRMSIEGNLFELTSYIPKPSSAIDSHYRLFYPNEQLSKILIDNYAPLLKFSSTYFNLSLASHITKYMVELAYMLQYWEVYHLLYLLPDLEYILKLVDIEVVQTPFGPLVRPPKNLMVESMSQGLQYPFPYPFYNYSYHSLDPTVKKRKYSKINITPYIDITLANLQNTAKKRQLDAPTPIKTDPAIKNVDTNNIEATKSKEKVTRNEIEKITDKADDSKEYEYRTRGTTRRQRNDLSQNYNETFNEDENEIEDENEVKEEQEQEQENEIYEGAITHEADETPIPEIKESSEAPPQQEDKENYDNELEREVTFSQSPSSENYVKNNDDSNQFEIKIIHSGSEKGLTDEEAKKNKSKSGVIHQCHLMDPHTMKTCLKIFYGKNELLRHQEFVHATKKKIYKCIYCSRNGTKVQSYPRHDSLARHIRRKHGITGKENKMAVNYAKENVEVIDDPSKLPRNQSSGQFGKPLPRPQFLNSDFTIKSSYAGFLLFSTRDGQSRNQPGSSSSNKSKATNDSDVLSPPNASLISNTSAISNTSPDTTSIDKSPNPDSLSLHSQSAASPSTSPSRGNVNINSVNFNKPEASVIKDNFQKFRFSSPVQLHKYQFEADKDSSAAKPHANSMDVANLNSSSSNAVQKLHSNEELTETDLLSLDPYNLPSSVSSEDASKLQTLILDLRKKRDDSKPLLN